GGVLAHRRGGGLHAHRLVVDELALPRHHYYRAAEAAVGDLFLQRRADLGEPLRGHADAFGLRRRQRRRGRRERGERDDEREPGERGARGPHAIHGWFSSRGWDAYYALARGRKQGSPLSDGATLALRRHTLRRLLRSDDRMNFEFDQVRPAAHPLFEQCPVRGLHDLVTSRQVLGDPARNVVQPFGGEATAFP